MQDTPPIQKPRPSDEDGGFVHLLAQTKAYFASFSQTERPLFKTDWEDLFATFLEHLPPPWRQHYTCSCCRRFVRSFGGLAVVGEDGRLSSAVWPSPEAVPQIFQGSVEALRRRVEGAKISGVFLTAHETIWTPQTGEWNHLALSIPAARRHRGLVMNAGQLAAEKAQGLEAGHDPQPMLVSLIIKF